MSYNTNQNPVRVKSTDSNIKQATATEQLKSTARVFCEACNQIVKGYLCNYHETNAYQTINLSFAQKVIKKTKLSFSQLIVTLVYLNRYYQSCTIFNKHIPGHEEAVIPSLSHVILLCIIQAERYITDIPHKLSWWAEICAGQTKSKDINRWQLDFFDTINYKLYVHPEKDYNIFKVEIKRLAARLSSNLVVMPPQFRRSVCNPSQITPTSAPSSQTTQLPSQPNVLPAVEPNVNVQPRILLSPLYSGNSASVQTQQTQTAILSSQTNMLTSPLASVNSDNNNNNQNAQNLGVPVLNITNTSLTTSPVELSDNSIINQTRSPNSIYNNSTYNNNSLPNDTRQYNNNTSPLPPTQNPNHLMVKINSRSPIRCHSSISSCSSTSSNSSILLSNNQPMRITNSPVTSQNLVSSPITTQNLVSSPVNSQNLVNSPVDMSKKETVIIRNSLRPRPIKRKRSYYGQFPASITEQFLKATQNIKRARITMTISPEETDQPKTPIYKSMEENNKKENSSSSNNQESSKDSKNKEQPFQTIDKGKGEEISSSSSESSHTTAFFRLSGISMTNNVENSFLTSETIPNSNIENVMGPLNHNVVTNSEEIIASSLLLGANNSTSLTLIPVSPPLTPQ